MFTESQTKVLQMLGAVELPRGSAARIEALGNDAVTLLCDAALGSFVGIAAGQRHRAAFLVGCLSHPQALETLPLLVGSDAPGVARRALRALRRRQRVDAVLQIQALLDQDGTPPTLAAEAILTLAALNAEPARAVIAGYERRAPAPGSHRGAAVVRRALARAAASRT